MVKQISVLPLDPELIDSVWIVQKFMYNANHKIVQTSQITVKLGYGSSSVLCFERWKTA